jgi:hypothetical protein
MRGFCSPAKSIARTVVVLTLTPTWCLYISMTLDEYMREQRLTNSEFGRRINVAAETVRRYRIGERWPDREQMQLIVDATAGAVTPNDFLQMSSSDLSLLTIAEDMEVIA